MVSDKPVWIRIFYIITTTTTIKTTTTIYVPTRVGHLVTKLPPLFSIFPQPTLHVSVFATFPLYFVNLCTFGLPSGCLFTTFISDALQGILHAL
jgi:hypothetical protein